MLAHAAIITLDNGKRIVYPTEFLYSLIPDELEVAEQIRAIFQRSSKFA
jgi:tRNA A37 threonylcarbamoyladenosine synthetase subunit TsaC/SUA5/YrdC